MKNIYEVEVDTESVKYVTRIFGLPEAVKECTEASKCANVLEATVTDRETGEIILRMIDGVAAK